MNTNKQYKKLKPKFLHLIPSKYELPTIYTIVNINIWLTKIKNLKPKFGWKIRICWGSWQVNGLIRDRILLSTLTHGTYTTHLPHFTLLGQHAFYCGCTHSAQKNICIPYFTQVLIICAWLFMTVQQKIILNVLILVNLAFIMTRLYFK